MAVRSKALTLRKKKNRKRNKTHGFLVRSKTPGGRKTIARRRQKGRQKLTV